MQSWMDVLRGGLRIGVPCIGDGWRTLWEDEEERFWQTYQLLVRKTAHQSRLQTRLQCRLQSTVQTRMQPRHTDVNCGFRSQLHAFASIQTRNHLSSPGIYANRKQQPSCMICSILCITVWSLEKHQLVAWSAFKTSASGFPDGDPQASPVTHLTAVCISQYDFSCIPVLVLVHTYSTLACLPRASALSCYPISYFQARVHLHQLRASSL